MRKDSNTIKQIWEELDGELRLSALLGPVKRQNPVKLAFPRLYSLYYEAIEADDLETAEDIKTNTPTLTSGDYLYCAVKLFIDRLESQDWEVMLGDKQRLLFHSQIGESWFEISNADLGVWMGIVGEKAGIPERLYQSHNFAKSCIGALKHRIKIEDKQRENEEREQKW